jgi:hypothetical protein
MKNCWSVHFCWLIDTLLFNMSWATAGYVSYPVYFVATGLPFVDEDKSPCLDYSLSLGLQWCSICGSQYITNCGLCVLYMYSQFILLSLPHKVGSYQGWRTSRNVRGIESASVQLTDNVLVLSLCAPSMLHFLSHAVSLCLQCALCHCCCLAMHNVLYAVNYNLELLNSARLSCISDIYLLWFLLLCW